MCRVVQDIRTSGKASTKEGAQPIAAQINHTRQVFHSTALDSASRGIHNSRQSPPYLVKREHVTRNVSFREPRSSVREEVSPFPLERLERGGISEPGVPFRHRVHRHVGLQSTAPFSQCPWVMSSVVLDELDREPVLGCFGRGVYQGRGTWESRVGPHVAAHEVLWLVSHVTGFWERRGSDDGGGVLVLQSPVYEFEVGLVMLSSHMLKRTVGLVREGKKVRVPTSSISTLTRASKRPAHSTGIPR